MEKVTPPSVLVETAKQNSERNSNEIRDELGFLRIALLVFAFVALLVGAFLIFNTFSITVAQRVTEFGMLRTLGASRSQILTSVVVEALAIGILGAVLGLAGGFAIAKGLNALFVAIGIDLPTTSLVVETRTIVVSLAIGIVVTLVSSLVPALRSTRVPPIAALQALEMPRSRRREVAYAALAALLGVAGLAMVVIALFGGASGGIRRRVDRRRRGRGDPRRLPLQPDPGPAAGVARRQAAGSWSRKLTGRLARENTQRNPARTAVTAAALMIGLAVVAFVTVFAAGIKSSIASAVDDSFQGQLVIQNTDGFSPISPGAAAAAAQGPRGRAGRDDAHRPGEGGRRRRQAEGQLAPARRRRGPEHRLDRGRPRDPAESSTAAR